MMVGRKRVDLFLTLMAVLWVPGATWAADTKAAPDLTAAQIVEKHVAARGGLAAWR